MTIRNTITAFAVPGPGRKPSIPKPASKVKPSSVKLVMPDMSKSDHNRGTKTKSKTKPQNKGNLGFSVDLKMDFKSKGKNKPVSDSIYSYDIESSDTPVVMHYGKDSTLYTDWNVTPTRPVLSTNPNTLNNITLLADWSTEFWRSDSALSPFASEFRIHYKRWLDTLNSKTNASQGSVGIFTEDAVIEYLDTVGRCYDALIELESVIAWNPTDEQYSNQFLREVAVKLSNTDILGLRNAMRETLVPHSLPEGLIKHSSFVREYHLKNEFADSHKLSVRSLQMFRLQKDILEDGTYSTYRSYVEEITTNVNKLNSRLCSLISTYLADNGWYSLRNMDYAYRAASHDVAFLDAFNNTPLVYKQTGQQNPQSLPPVGPKGVSLAIQERGRDKDGKHLVSDIAVASASSRLSHFTDLVGQLFLPCYKIVIDDSETDNSYCRHYGYYDATANKYRFRGTEKWYENIADFTVCPEDMTVAQPKYNNGPRGNSTLMYYASDNNVGMAIRRVIATILT